VEFRASWQSQNQPSPDNAWYFITGSTLDNARFFKTTDKMKLWLDAYFSLLDEFHFISGAWVLLDNHYHILIQPPEAKDTGKFIGRLHGRTARAINEMEDQPNRRVWYRFWNVRLQSERQFWMRLNAIHYNPVKHGLVPRPQEWFFSSYRPYYESDDKDWLKKLWKEYPVARIEADYF
jgi:putative transposase